MAGASRGLCRGKLVGWLEDLFFVCFLWTLGSLAELKIALASGQVILTIPNLPQH